jgi:hypothetical protein
MIVNNGVKRIIEEGVIAYFKAIFQNWCRGKVSFKTANLLVEDAMQDLREQKMCAPTTQS